MKKILAAMIASGLLIASPVNAEVRNYEGVGEYIMSDFETPDVAKQRAKLYAERNAQEKAGVYIKSYSRSSNFELIDDEVVSMTSGILKVLDVDYKMVPMEEYGGIMYRATIMASIDTDKVDQWISKGVSERESLVEKNIELKKQLDEQQNLIEKLKAEAQKNSTPENRERLQQAFSEADRIFMSNIKLEEGNRFVLIISDWGNEQALKCWTEAIELNPQNALAYEARGYYYLYYTLNYADSLADYNQAVSLNPSNAENYFYRGTCYLNLNDLDSAKRDFEQALALNPSMSDPYGELAYIYTMSDPLKAIEYADRALEFDERNWRALYSRGLALFTMHNYEAALADAQEALRWGCGGDAYQLIGDCYGMLGLPEDAKKYWELAKNPPALG